MHVRLPAIFGLALISCLSPTIEKQKTIGGDEPEELQIVPFNKGWRFHYWWLVVFPKIRRKNDLQPWNFLPDFWIIKFNKKGEIQWQKSIGGTNFDYIKNGWKYFI